MRKLPSGFFLLLAFLMILDLELFVWWSTGPPGISNSWKSRNPNEANPTDLSLAKRMRSWANLERGPRTPLCFLIVLELPEEILLATAIVIVFGVAGLPRLVETIQPPMKFRTAIIGVAILAILLSWDIREHRIWRRCVRYMDLAINHADSEVDARIAVSRSEALVMATDHQILIHLMDREEARLSGNSEPVDGSKLVDSVLKLKGLRRKSAEAHLEAERAAEKREYHRRLAKKYEEAAKQPWIAVEPDPPEP